MFLFRLPELFAAKLGTMPDNAIKPWCLNIMFVVMGFSFLFSWMAPEISVILMWGILVVMLLNTTSTLSLIKGSKTKPLVRYLTMTTVLLLCGTFIGAAAAKIGLWPALMNNLLTVIISLAAAYYGGKGIDDYLTRRHLPDND